MKEYPFDRHIIPMSLGTRKWKENKVKHLWSILPSMPDWVDEPYPEDKCIINENVAWIDPHAEIGHLPPVVHIKEDGKPVLCIRVQRDPSYFIYTVSIPICAIVLLCLSSFFLSFNNATDRLNAVLVSTLALAAYKNSVEVYMHIFIYLCAVCVCVCVCVNVAVTFIRFKPCTHMLTYLHTLLSTYSPNFQ
jgi:ABC-type polysaccharide/polyol phosphate export permease